MKDYEKPVVKINDNASEGVYAASGAGEVSTDCWNVDAYCVQPLAGGTHNVFEVKLTHLKDMAHISSNTEVTLIFSATLTDAYSEFPCSFSGDTVVVNRELHANAYHSGDCVTYKVWVSTGDPAITESITCTHAGISCTHQVNVQGEYD